MSSKATVGRIVHYLGLNGKGPYAAIVTDEKDGETIDITVMYPPGAVPVGSPSMAVAMQDVPHAAKDRSITGYWNWMPYQQAQQAKEATKD